MVNKFNRCFTPTSLWKEIQELGTGTYRLVVDGNNIKVTQVEE